MEYKGLSANTEEVIANLMADFAKDTFKPLDDPGFHYFQHIEGEWKKCSSCTGCR